MKSILSAALAITLTLTLVLLAFLLTGCTGENGIVAPDVAKNEYPTPDSPDQLMANFAVAYGTRDLEAYAATLHPDFVFETASLSGAEPEIWDRGEELRIAANMFSGENRVKDGVVVPGITQIEFIRCVGLGEWQPVALDGVGGNALQRTYNVHVCFVRDGGADIFVRGTCVFTVVGTPVERPDGRLVGHFQIARWQDRTAAY